MNKKNRYSRGTGEHLYRSSAAAAAACAPGVTTCGHFDATLTGGQWLSNVEVTEEIDGSSIHDCSTWCLQQVDSCKIKDMLMLPGVERCGFIDGGDTDSEIGESGKCVAMAGVGMTVISQSASFFLAPVDCNINKYGITPCEPTPGQVCEDEGIPIATAQSACAGVASFDECVYDFCASGGECDDICTGFGDDPPPPPSPSPALPPPPAPDGEAYDDPHVKTLSGNKFFMHGVACTIMLRSARRLRRSTCARSRSATPR